MKHHEGVGVRGAVLGILLLCVSAPIYGHHSSAMFDPRKTITIEGTVTEMAWANPHSVFFFDAKETGVKNSTMKNWSIVAPRPVALESIGWKRNTIKVGDKITVTGNPRRDGKPQFLLKEMIDASGKHFSTK